MATNPSERRADRLQAAIARFDAANAEDPRRELDEGVAVPKELLYARRMSAWLERLEPRASEALRLAARSQHLCRWRIPRSDYPRNRKGYRQWRRDCALMHARLAAEILDAVGYGPGEIARVQDLLLKKNLKSDPETQILEDVACLVFLQHHFEAFAREHDEPKLVRILERTWRKMSSRGRRAALQLEMPEPLRRLVSAALGGA